jgi:hypothetical protein
MVLEDPLWQDGNDYPARLDRQFIEAVFDVEGVIKPSTGALLVGPRGAGANMSVDVAPGPWVIKGDDEANQGHYLSRSTAVENRPVGAAPGSDSRIDLVVAQVRDAKVTGGVSSDWDIVVIPGAVAAAPVAPAVPNTAIPLAEVLVAAGTASITAGMITDRRTAAGNAAYTPLAGIASKNADAAPSTYPSGVSHMGVGGAQTGWPASIGGTVITVRNSGIRVYQEFVEANGNNPPIAVRRWFRQGYSDGAGIDAWGPFQSVMTKADRLTAVAVNGTQADFGAATTRTLSTVLAIPGDWAEYRLSWLFTTQLQNLGTTGRSVTAHSAYNGTTTLFGTQGHIETVRAADSVITSVTGYLDVAAGVTGNRTFEMTLTASALDASLKSDNLTLHVTATRS